MKFPVKSLLAGNLAFSEADSPLQGRVLCEPELKERWYGAGGEEMAPSSLQPTDGVP